MRHPSSICVPVLALVLSAAPRAGWAAEPPAQEPVGTALEEKVQVTLIQIDALVMDRNGKTVPDLKKDDFTMKIAGVPVPVTHVDLTCPVGAAADPEPLTDAQAPPPLIAPGTKRRVVFAFDYPFLDVTIRPQVLEAAKSMLRMSKTDDEEVMIVALASEVRVEQKFTKDLRLLLATLSRMKTDVTLWARDFPVGTTGRGYFGNLSTLMDVLGSYDGSKAVVLFSQANSVGAAMRDLYYNDVSAHAAAGHAAIYPSRPDLLDSLGPGDTLVRLADKTGGRMQFLGNDISLPYRRAQRDLSCRYTVAARLDPATAEAPQALSLNLARPGLSIRTPEMVQLFTEEARQQARAGAAYVDPGPFERPLVRAFAFSAIPSGADKWSTLLAVNFPAPVGPSGADIDVRAVVRRDNQSVVNLTRRVHVAPPADGATSRPVTVLGNAKLSDGQYDFTVILTDPAGGEIVTAQTDFVVPLVLQDLLMLRGPIMGRVVPGGEFLGSNPDRPPETTRIGKVLGPGNSFEPLLVEQIDRPDNLLFYWSACVSGTNPLPADVVVSRTFLTSTGEIAKAFDPVPLKLEPRRAAEISCHDMLETLAGNTLAPGDYRLDVTVAHPNGDVIARGTQPLTVR